MILKSQVLFPGQPLGKGLAALESVQNTELLESTPFGHGTNCLCNRPWTSWKWETGRANSREKITEYVKILLKIQSMKYEVVMHNKYYIYIYITKKNYRIHCNNMSVICSSLNAPSWMAWKSSCMKKCTVAAHAALLSIIISKNALKMLKYAEIT